MSDDEFYDATQRVEQLYTRWTINRKEGLRLLQTSNWREMSGKEASSEVQRPHQIRFVVIRLGDEQGSSKGCLYRFGG